MSLVTSQHVRTAQALNRLLEATGLPAIEITDADVLQGAIIEAQSALHDGNVDLAKKILREAVTEKQ